MMQQKPSIRQNKTAGLRFSLYGKKQATEADYGYLKDDLDIKADAALNRKLYVGRIHSTVKLWIPHNQRFYAAYLSYGKDRDAQGRPFSQTLVIDWASRTDASIWYRISRFFLAPDHPLALDAADLPPAIHLPDSDQTGLEDQLNQIRQELLSRYTTEQLGAFYWHTLHGERRDFALGAAENRQKTLYELLVLLFPLPDESLRQLSIAFGFGSFFDRDKKQAAEDQWSIIVRFDANARHSLFATDRLPTPNKPDQDKLNQWVNRLNQPIVLDEAGKTTQQVIIEQPAVKPSAEVDPDQKSTKPITGNKPACYARVRSRVSVESANQDKWLVFISHPDRVWIPVAEIEEYIRSVESSVPQLTRACLDDALSLPKPPHLDKREWDLRSGLLVAIGIWLWPREADHIHRQSAENIRVPPLALYALSNEGKTRFETNIKRHHQSPLVEQTRQWCRRYDIQGLSSKVDTFLRQVR